jgi:acyl homoserine lactone synthase
MHELRYRVFHQRLGWEVTTAGNAEFDRFDSLRPIWLLHIGDEGRVDGGVRLLPSTGPTMIEQVFPVLLGGTAMPRDPLVWEASRFAADVGGEGRQQARMVGQITVELFAGLCELGLAMGWKQVIAVTDLRLEKIGVRAGLRFERFSEPRQIGKTKAVAGVGPVDRTVLRDVRRFGGLEGSVLRFSGDRDPIRIAA